jgi:hypothetical protein
MARKAAKEARRELHELFMRRFGGGAYLKNPPPPPTIPEIARDAKIASREFEVALAHISELVDSAPDPNFSRQALGQLLCSANMLATSSAGLMVALMREIDDLHRHNGAVNGRRSGEKRQAKQAEKWADEGLAIAKEYVASHPKYSQDDLASHIEHMLDPPVTHGRIKNVIGKWVKDGKLPKKAR